jgi:hypothetical protein
MTQCPSDALPLKMPKFVCEGMLKNLVAERAAVELRNLSIVTVAA